MATKFYDPDQLSLVFANIPISGFADGEFVRITPESDGFGSVVGTDGEVSRSKTGDKRAEVVFVLMQTSDTNDRLSALHQLDLATPGGAGVGALMIRDRQGRAQYSSEQAWIQRAPDVSFDREATSREWVLMCGDLKRVDGGNF